MLKALIAAAMIAAAPQNDGGVPQLREDNIAEVVAAMTENAKRNRRYTGLKLRLQGRCR